MPSKLGGTVRNNAKLGGTVLNGRIGGSQIWSTTAAARAFTLADAGISFSVSQAGLVSLSITAGTFVNTNYDNGDNLGTVSSDTTRTLTGSVRVPNDSTLWTNAPNTPNLSLIHI